MKLAAFNALSSYTTLLQVQGLSVGTYFLFGNESKQKGNTSLRHLISYHQRVAADANSLAGQGSLIYRRVFDLLESDDLANQTKTTTRPGLNRAPERDDDDRKFYKESDYS